MTKQDLLIVLNEPYGTDEDIAHARAEEALLAYVNDPEITEAWNKARDEQNWWYA